MAGNGKAPIIEVRDLVVDLKGHRILNGVTLDVYRGEILGFVGASGAGKSVLTRTIVGLLPKQQGRIDVFGVDLDEIQTDERLREKEFGILDRHTKRGILSKFPELAAQRALVGKFYFRPPGGESWCDVILRVRSIVEVLRRDHVEDRVLIVAHQVIVNCFRYLLECMDETKILGIDREADVPNCGITEYGIDKRQPDARFALRTANMVLPLVEAGAPVTTAPDEPAGPK